ncbi:hypothetical protein GCM10027427_35940 [Pseudoclavibacter terrae]
MTDNIEQCKVAFSWELPDGLPNVHTLENGSRRLVVAPRELRVEHWPASDSPGALHVFISGTRVRIDGTLGGNKGLGYSDEPERWAGGPHHTDDLPDWARPYVEAARAWETERGNPRQPRLRLL